MHVMHASSAECFQSRHRSVESHLRVSNLLSHRLPLALATGCKCHMPAVKHAQLVEVLHGYVFTVSRKATWNMTICP